MVTVAYAGPISFLEETEGWVTGFDPAVLQGAQEQAAQALEADEAALLGLLPEGEITDISQLPSSIPSYLIEVVPELKLGDQVILTGDSLRLGEEVRFSYTPLLAGGRIGAPNPYDVIAGSYLAVAAIAGNVAPISLEQSRTRIEATRAILESEDPGALEGLTREDLLGELFHAGLLGYYGQYTTLAYVAGLRQGGHHTLGAGLGTFGYEPSVHTVLGLPMAIQGGGAVMNIPILNLFGHDNDGTEAGRQSRVDYILQVGTLSSALEHAVPEQMFVTEETPGEAISAVRALEKASAQGQRIYHITPANRAQVLPNIHHNAQVMAEINQALSAGREVITHTHSVSVPGWSGAGYILFDPVTGDGAYKIGGGANGGGLYIVDTFAWVAGTNFGYKNTLARLLGASTIAKTFSSISAFAAFTGFVVGLHEIGTRCSTEGTAAAIALFTAISMAAIALTIGLLAAPVFSFVAGVVLGSVVNHLKNKIIESDLCAQ